MTIISKQWHDELNQSKEAEYVTLFSVLSTQRLSVMLRGNVQSFWVFFSFF